VSAINALRAARKAGVEILIDGNDLVLEAPAAPSGDVLDLLSDNKAAIVALLRSGSDGCSEEDWQAFFDERAGIAEYDGGLPRDQAEASAFAQCIREQIRLYRPRSLKEAHAIASLEAMGIGKPAAFRMKAVAA
jgi:hypothetical protein